MGPWGPIMGPRGPPSPPETSHGTLRTPFVTGVPSRCRRYPRNATNAVPSLPQIPSGTRPDSPCAWTPVSVTVGGWDVPRGCPRGVPNPVGVAVTRTRVPAEGRSLKDEDVLQSLPVGTTATFYFRDLGAQISWVTVRCPSVCLSVPLSIHPSIPPSHHPPVYPAAFPSPHSVHPSVPASTLFIHPCHAS